MTNLKSLKKMYEVKIQSLQSDIDYVYDIADKMGPEAQRTEWDKMKKGERITVTVKIDRITYIDPMGERRRANPYPYLDITGVDTSDRQIHISVSDVSNFAMDIGDIGDVTNVGYNSDFSDKTITIKVTASVKGVISGVLHLNRCSLLECKVTNNNVTLISQHTLLARLFDLDHEFMIRYKHTTLVRIPEWAVREALQRVTKNLSAKLADAKAVLAALSEC